MTMLASWIGIDTHGVSSAYIVSDSRFSWSNNKYFDYGKKVFACSMYPEIFGYSGDVLFPSTVLSQIVEMIDSDVLYKKEMSCQEKNKIIFEKLCFSLSKYPTDCSADTIQIIHISRDTIFSGYPNFYCYSLFWSKRGDLKTQMIKQPKKSDVLCILGSGKKEFIENYARYQLGKNKDTSRNVFHCFIDTLFNTKDANCGGPPQLVGIYRKPNTYAKNFGIVYNSKRYFLGSEVPTDSFYNNVEWRNEFFELCDGTIKRTIETAAKQPDLLRRK